MAKFSRDNRYNILDKKQVHTPEEIELATYLEDMMSNYEGLLDMQVNFSAELGSTTVSLADILRYEKGSTIDLQKPAGASVETFVNGRVIGKGEVMVYEKNLAIRINEILDSNAIVYYIARESKEDEV
ncbi:flagellar motor switch protein [Helicobacter sp. 13S00401-1]|uniref:flagellar motor switch protein FliN n=1 Tax=Helicobacter sp. 13S00401-1 TaxID=1905758 RepID=UPI000BA6E0CA|nr:flagellar motor switch protein FliN [Helicobacter sp. 13S00401-1]PAF48796.1 flagellar motor switch protein [Helicobacter sp. 13S00401-1]